MRWLLVLTVVVFAGCGNHNGEYVLVNRASDSIGRASVTVCGQTTELHDLAPGAEARSSYDVTSDSHYTVKVEFQSGRTLSKELGYVTNGMEFRHRLTVTDSGVEIAALSE